MLLVVDPLSHHIPVLLRRHLQDRPVEIYSYAVYNPGSQPCQLLEDPSSLLPLDPRLREGEARLEEGSLYLRQLRADGVGCEDEAPDQGPVDGLSFRSSFASGRARRKAKAIPNAETFRIFSYHMHLVGIVASPDNGRCFSPGGFTFFLL